MPVLDTTEFDFSQEHALGADNVARRTTLVRNQDAHAVLHLGVKSPVPWLELYPMEFALAPHETQTVTVELRPEQARNASLTMTSIAVFGQYIALDAADAGALPPDVAAEISVIPPIANCPHCAADLPDGARECRRCGERIRLCPVCGTPNTWLARVCRLSPAHIIRREVDWLQSPGGDATHTTAPRLPLGIHLARRWSSPAFPVSRAVDAEEWSAPLAAFGMVIASSIDTERSRATVQAFELATGGALWDFDLPDPKGIYPDRGAMALSEDGLLYAATLGGQLVAMDAIRGTRLWAASVPGPVYGGVTTIGDLALIPSGLGVTVIDRWTGEMRRTLTLGGRLDTAPAALGDLCVAACDDSFLYAFDLADGHEIWRVEADGPFDAAPLLLPPQPPITAEQEAVVYAATMRGTVYALSAGTGEIIWKTNVSSQAIAAAPALSADGLLYVPADDGFIHIIAADTGNLTRSRRVSATPLRTSPVCSNETVFLGADDGNLYAIDADYVVHRAYETTPGARISTAGLALYGETVVAAATNGVLYVLRATA